MDPIRAKIGSKTKKIVKLLKNGDLELASARLTALMHSDEIHSYWKANCFGGSVPTVMHHVDRVYFDADTDTARIYFRDGQNGTMLIGAGFFRRHLAKKVENLLFLLLHERNHVVIAALHHAKLGNLLGMSTAEFSKFKRSKTFDYIEDSYINGISRRVVKSALPEEAIDEKDLRTAFLTNRFAKVQEYVDSLASVQSDLTLRSKLAWVGNSAAKIHGFLYQAPRPPSYLNYFSTLWSFFKLLREEDKPDACDAFIDPDAESEEEVQLDPSTGTSRLSSGLSRIVPDGIEPGSKIEGLIRGMSEGEQTMLGVAAPAIGKKSMKDVSAEINRLVSDAFVTDRISSTAVPSTSMTVRDRFLLGGGVKLTRFQHQKRIVGHSDSDKTPELAVYFDVSGSMVNYYAVVPWIASQLSMYKRRVYQFSTWLGNVSPDLGLKPEQIVKVNGMDGMVEVDPLDKVLWSTGGTIYDIVAIHILETKPSRVIVVTDTTDTISQVHLKELNGLRNTGQLDLTLLETEIGFAGKLPQLRREELRNNSFHVLANAVIPIRADG